MTDPGTMGPVSYLVVEFPGSKVTGEGFPILVGCPDGGGVSGTEGQGPRLLSLRLLSPRLLSPFERPFPLMPIPRKVPGSLPGVPAPPRRQLAARSATTPSDV